MNLVDLFYDWWKLVEEAKAGFSESLKQVDLGNPINQELWRSGGEHGSSTRGRGFDSSWQLFFFFFPTFSWLLFIERYSDEQFYVASVLVASLKDA